MKLSGNVLIQLIVDRDGLPQNVHVIRSVGIGLDDNAIAAVKQYRFTPAMEDGKPVAVQLNIEVNFQLWDKDGVAAPAAVQQTTVGAAGGTPAAGYPPPVAVPGCAIDTTAISRGTGVGISGFLGFPTLRELVISIDYRDSLVHMVYNPTKGYHAPSQMIGP